MTSDEGMLLLDMAERLFSEQSSPEVVSAAEETWPASLWHYIEESGLALALVPEDSHGSDLTLSDVLPLVSMAAGHAAPVPVGETMLAAAALARAGLEVPSGPLALGWSSGDALRFNRGQTTVDGSATRVPWGRDVAAVVVLARSGPETFLCVIHPDAFVVERHRNLAFEPRDTLIFTSADVAACTPVADLSDTFALQSALLRAAQIEGALKAILGLTVQYANERVQFGRPISRFQAVSGLLAEIAMEAAAASAAVAAAVSAVDAVGWVDADGPIAVAKIRCGQAATVAVERSHQVHGAIGTTREHRLQLLTRRLWSWRDEYGTEQEWALRLGRRALAAGRDRLWEFATELV